MAIHLALGVIFTGVTVYVLVLYGVALFEPEQLSGGTNRWGYVDNGTSPIAFALLFFVGFACFSWVGFAEDMRFLRRKSRYENGEAPEKTELNPPDPARRHRKGRRSRSS